MEPNATAPVILERVYLEVRAKLLDIAACLDRIDRADPAAGIETDARFRQLLDGIEILATATGDRAERIQMLFSDAYVPGWNRRNGARRDRDSGEKAT